MSEVYIRLMFTTYTVVSCLMSSLHVQAWYAIGSCTTLEVVNIVALAIEIMPTFCSHDRCG